MTHKEQFEKYSDEHLQVELIRHPHCKIELKVHCDEHILKKAKKLAIKKVNKEITLAGFRKGKAPEELVVQKYPKEIEEKLHATLANEVFVQALKIIPIQVLQNGPKVAWDVTKLQEKEADVAFVFECEPTLQAIDISSFTLPEIPERAVGKTEVDEALLQAQFFYASWENITDRPAQDKDFVIVDIETLEPPKEKPFENIRFEMRETRIANWLKTLLIGMKIGEAKEGISEPDEDASEKEKEEFKPKKVLVTLKEIQVPKLPPLDDQFAQKMGAKDLPSLKESIEKMLKDKVIANTKEEKRNAVNKFLLSNNSIDLPESLLQKEVEFRMRQILESSEGKKKYDQLSEPQKKEQLKNLREQSEEALSLFYLARKLVHDEKIKVSYHEVMSEAYTILQASGGQAKVDPKQVPEEVYALAFSKVLLKKAQDYILEQSKNQG